jgi:hypothetical protein
MERKPGSREKRVASRPSLRAEGLRMKKSDIQKGHYYVGKTGFVRRVLDIYHDDGADRVEWDDTIGSGNCFLVSFASWARREVEKAHFGKHYIEVA